jgi:hypothetical protein
VLSGEATNTNFIVFGWIDLILIFGVLTPLSAIFQLWRQTKAGPGDSIS